MDAPMTGVPGGRDIHRQGRTEHNSSENDH
jgi:hypothetical protein